MTLTLIGIASAVATGIAMPLLVWLVKAAVTTVKRTSTLPEELADYKRDNDMRFCEPRRDLDEAKKQAGPVRVGLRASRSESLTSGLPFSVRRAVHTYSRQA